MVGKDSVEIPVGYTISDHLNVRGETIGKIAIFRDLTKVYKIQEEMLRMDRLVSLGLDTKSVECYSASLEDIVASKLYSGRETDAADVRRPEVLGALDWDRLAAVVADMEGSTLVERRHREFLHNYAAYRKEFGPCDD